MTGSGRILVVDDEPQIRRVMKTALTAHGYEAFEARTGEEALNSLRESSFIEWDAETPVGAASDPGRGRFLPTQLGRAARDRCAARYSIERIGAALAAVVDQVLA